MKVVTELLAREQVVHRTGQHAKFDHEQEEEDCGERKATRLCAKRG